MGRKTIFSRLHGLVVDKMVLDYQDHFFDHQTELLHLSNFLHTKIPFGYQKLSVPQ